MCPADLLMVAPQSKPNLEAVTFGVSCSDLAFPKQHDEVKGAAEYKDITGGFKLWSWLSLQ